VLSAIDKAIQYPVIFEIMRTAAGKPQVRMVATYKLLGSGVPKLSSYYSTSWLSSDLERSSLPTAISLPTLYAAIMNPLMPVTVRFGEEMSVVAERLVVAGRLERDITALERKISIEPQLNRKIELRRSLKIRQQELEQQR
jgi:head-tail adaptor